MAALAALVDEHKQRQVPVVCPGHSRPIAQISYSAVTGDGTFLISACHDKLPMLRLADDTPGTGERGDWVGTYAGHKGAVWSARLCPQALLAATGSGDFTALLWDAVTGKQIYEFVHKHIVKTVAFSPNRSWLATGGQEGLLRLFDLAQPEAEPVVLEHLAAEGKDGTKTKLTHADWLSDVMLLTGTEDGRLRAWDTRTNTVTTTLELGAAVRDLELSRGGGVVTVAAGDAVSFFDGRDLSLLQKYDMPVHFLNEGGASLHPTLPRFIVGGGRHGGSNQGAMGVRKDATRVGDLDSDLMVYTFDYASGAQMEAHKGHCGPVRCLRYHPDGKTYATGSEDATIRIWETEPETQ